MAKFVMRIVLVLWVLALCVSMLGLTVCAATDPVSATIQVNTALSGSLPDKPESFVVEMTADQAGAPMPQGAEDGVYTMKLQGAASGKIQMSYDRVGVYSYTIRQLPNADADCVLDSGVYHATVYVTSGTRYDDLYASAVLTREGAADKQEQVVFSNRYASAVEVAFRATTTLDKKTPESARFTFQLKNGKDEVLQTVKNDGRNVVFEPLKFDKPGTYTYTITQVTGDDPKIIYDQTTYTAVVTVTKNADGEYQVQLTYKLADKVLEDEPHFANKTKSATPQTGDRTNPGFLMAMLLISGSALAGLWYYDRRRQRSL